jgi:hypothetical protein
VLVEHPPPIACRTFPQECPAVLTVFRAPGHALEAVLLDKPGRLPSSCPWLEFSSDASEKRQRPLYPQTDCRSPSWMAETVS